MTCIVCAGPAVQRHHVIYAQEVRRRTGALKDERNLVPLCKQCHERHHTRTLPIPLRFLPDSVFEFAVELMGRGPAFEYLRRYYSYEDPRLDVLLEEKAA